MAHSPTKQRFVLESRFDQVARVQDAVITAATAHGFTESQIFAIRLAMEEALTNAIKHGNRLKPGKHVTVDMQVTDEQFCVVVTDDGAGFAPTGVPDPTLAENLECPSGRGVMLMKAYMTEVRFSPCGNCVTLIKRKDCHLPHRD